MHKIRQLDEHKRILVESSPWKLEQRWMMHACASLRLLYNWDAGRIHIQTQEGKNVPNSPELDV